MKAVHGAASRRDRGQDRHVRGLAAGDGQLAEAPWSALLQWCGSTTPPLEEARRWRNACPVFCHKTLRGRVGVGCLARAGQPRGLLLLDVSACTDDAECFAHFPALREPFAAAMENDRRLRELSLLREAAEAER